MGEIETQLLGIDDDLGEGRHIAQAQVQALAGDGMDAVGGIAH